METQSEVLVETVQCILAVEEVSNGAGDHEAVVACDNIPCQDLVLVNLKEQEAVLTEENILPVMKDEIEKCTTMLHSLPPSGIGKAPAVGANGTPLSASQAEIAEFPCKEVTPELVLAKEREGCDGDRDGKALAWEETSLPEFLPVLHDNGPARGDVPGCIPEEPIVPPRPPKRQARVPPECVEVDEIVQTMRNILFNLYAFSSLAMLSFISSHNQCHYRFSNPHHLCLDFS